MLPHQLTRHGDMEGRTRGVCEHGQWQLAPGIMGRNKASTLWSQMLVCGKFSHTLQLICKSDRILKFDGNHKNLYDLTSNKFEA